MANSTCRLGLLGRHLVASMIVLGLAFACPQSVNAGKTIYKCTQGGQIVLTDKPCDGATSSQGAAATNDPQSGATTIASSSSPSPIGQWSGEIQFHAVESGQELPEANTVVPGVAVFTAGRKISSATHDNGCAFLGVWSQGAPPNLIWIDVTLSGCRFPGLNRRYHGSFILAKPDSAAGLSAQAAENPHVGQMKARMFDIKGTLRRK